MADKQGAYGKQESASERTDSKWDLDVFKERAKEKDHARYERAKEHEEAAKSGKKVSRRRHDLPKPTQAATMRDEPLNLDANLNKTMVVGNTTGRGPGQPGFYCDLCRRVSKDSIAYLSHINSRSHLRRLGQTTQAARSTLDEVRAKIASLRAATAEASASKQYDFDARLKEVARAEEVRRAEEKQRRVEKKAEKRDEREKARKGEQVGGELAEMMGFGGFGTSKK